MKKTGLYFGTFNPIHIGHLVIANHMQQFSDLDEVWLVVTPQNPFKTKMSLLDNRHRYEMVYKATEAYPGLKPSDIEFELPQPNYTIHTLVHLQEKYPEKNFSLIMGEDNLSNFHKWKNHDVILKHHEIYVYPRVESKPPSETLKDHPNIHFVDDAPLMEISSTFIRKSIRKGKIVRPLLPDKVWEYIEEMNFYK
ncbi:nicotinate (nicotinamide) nucleotide adenylyltransferase [Robertkochia solimangrovi]|uniref:nicotinate (nicotinamide) nucleotide adenylyltransferase n=1 Tax=Robertkochia solimangrovi TaxID=2213046 RepID=UPI00117F30D3|nr:nicotinate (nicotinamide) nucleotide adenylyltransferase [Robertkochia solimangrovi]TRZ46446.1 nicotinic acid mononucleotide adenylyltransferase [Robertkochia solimangrovi]